MKCENCNKEHDGSYGTGRFCSRKCRYSWIGKKSNKTMKEHGLKNNFVNYNKCRTSPYGTWKCTWCNEIFETKKLLIEHKHKNHPIIKGSSWNKGLTKNNDIRVARHADTIKDGYKSGRLKSHNAGKHISEETRKKVSESMKKYYSEHPELIPYKLHHSSKESYPEKYFNNLLINEGITNFEREFPIKRYSLDFAFVKNKIDLEIDGSQHYTDNRIAQHDIKRTENLKRIGWKVVRVRWNEWKIKSFEEKKQWIENFKNIIYS